MMYKIGDKVKVVKVDEYSPRIKTLGQTLTISFVYEKDGIYDVEENRYWYADWMLKKEKQ